ncbi:MAG: PAS domain-containing protein [Deltaproteobacteria bacterium]|nr:PAS domain-containing protein [Deltaproteobacteria bacterium]
MAKVKHTSDALAKQMAIALLKMPPDSPAAKAARCAGWTIPLNYQSVRECLRELKVGPYRNLGEVTLLDVLSHYWHWILMIFGMFVVLAGATIMITRLNKNFKSFNLRLQSEVRERRQAQRVLQEKEEKLRAANRDLKTSNQNLEAAIARANQMAVEAQFAEMKLNQIYNTSGNGMWVIGTDLEALRINEAFIGLSGRTKEEAVGRKCYKVFPGEGCHTPECPLTRILGGEERVRAEIEKELPDGSTVPCLVTATAFRDTDGELIGIVEDLMDMTEHKRAEEQRLQQEKLQGVIEMAGAVCHELNQPMQAVFTHCELVMASSKKSGPWSEDLKRIKEQIQRMGEITRKLMRITKYETKDYVFDEKIIDIDRASRPDAKKDLYSVI